MGRLILLGVGVVLFFVQYAYPYQGSNELINIPSAKMMDMGYVELGTSMHFTMENNQGYFPQESFFRTALSKNFEYNIKVQEGGILLQSLHASFLTIPSEDKGSAQFYGIGFKDIGWISPGVNVTYPVYNFFISYTYAFLTSGLNFHVGFGKDYANNDALLPFFGADQGLPYGRAMAEWDGKGFNVGYKYVGDKYNVYFTFSPSLAANVGGQTRIFSFGVSFYENILIQMLKDWSQTRLKMEAAMSQTNTRLGVIEARNKATMEITSVQFLESLEKALIEKKLTQKRLDDGSKSIVKLSVNHMQRGMEYYYQEEFEKALEEYKVVISMLPKVPIGYIRIGSIYYQLGNKEKALEYWRMALKLDTDNKSLQAYVNNLIEDVKNDGLTNEAVEEEVVEPPAPEEPEPEPGPEPEPEPEPEPDVLPLVNEELLQPNQEEPEL